VDFNEISAYSEYDNDNYTVNIFGTTKRCRSREQDIPENLESSSSLFHSCALVWQSFATSFYLTEEYDASMRSLFVSVQLTR
jgi:hypothetical protein